ncbi:MAG: carbohydrate ABC transporter permease, partial [Candidatus Fermentibacterota bacterium]
NTYYEASRLDGAGWWGTFRHITWPLLSPTTYYVLIMSTIVSFQTFALVYVMTPPPGGGPLGTTNVIVFYLFRKAFDRFDIGYASAISVFLFAVLLSLTLLQRRLAGRRVHY